MVRKIKELVLTLHQFLAGTQDHLFNNVVPLFNILKMLSSKGVFEVSTPWLYFK
jgi:hypothetical protein